MDKYQILKKYFGYHSFREGQEILVDKILAGQDILGIMPTGSGKSLCYQIPALLLPGITLVISPLISLMKDQVQALNQAGIHAAYINSSLTESQITKALALAAKGRYKIIYAAPERLETYQFMEFASQTEISMVTVDEAHCISQWGQDFRPGYLKITQFVNRLSTRPIISAFTATATETVKEDIVCVLGLHNPHVLITGFDRKNLYFAVEKPKKKDGFLLEYIKEHKEESGIIYCATRKNTDTVCEILEREGIGVTKYHAGLSDKERIRNQDDFIYDKKPVIVATNAFGMGIDKSNVRYVLHYNMPQSLENYYQEAGRAGRDGENAQCTLLYSPQDVVINRFLLESKEGNTEFSREELSDVRERDEERLKQMTYYCITPECLRTYILRYFGEVSRKPCENCSNCQKEYEEINMTEAAKAVISCILECRQRYGINVIAGTLCGNDTPKLREYGVQSLKSFGSLKELSEARIKQLINHMLVDSVLVLTNDKYTILKVTSLADRVLNGDREVILKISKEQERNQETAGKSTARNKTTEILNSKGLDLFNELRSLRTLIAKREGLPPYIVFSDKTLIDMCVRLPEDRKEMLQVSGVGENKFQKYGEDFLNKIAQFTGGKKEKYYFGESTLDIFSDSQVLEKSKKKELKKQAGKEEFYITEEMEEKITYAENALISHLVNQLNELRDSDSMKKISGAKLIRWMTSEKYIGEVFEDGRRKKFVTEKGRNSGVEISMRASEKGTEYEDFYYSEKMQRLLVDLLKNREIL